MVQWSGFEAVHNINDKNSPVKLKIKDNSKSLQFKKWFGKSKVVDQNGEPMKVYHGTDRYGFSVFREDSHFTASREYAARYANKGRKDTKSGVYEVYLSIQNPFDIRNASDRKKDKNKSVINFYSDRTSDTGAHNVSSGIITESVNNIQPFLGKYKSNGLERTDTDGLRFSVAEYSEEEQRDIVDVLKTFTGSIVGLLEYANAPSSKYPEGRRKAAGRSILDRFIYRFSAK